MKKFNLKTLKDFTAIYIVTHLGYILLILKMI